MNYKIFDAHFHIIDPEFPIIENKGYLPSAFTVQNYEAQRPKHIIGGTVVSGSYQGFDQTYLVAALKKLGPSYVGITQLPVDATDEEIIKLNKVGVRGIRFNLYRGGSEGLDKIKEMAARVYDLAKWHVELYADTAKLGDIVPTLLKLPHIAIDHLGMSLEGLPTTIKLAEAGAKIKATGFSRTNLNIPKALQAINSANPNALMFATDMPSTRAPRPFSEADIQVLVDTLGDASKRVLFDNAYNFYKPNGKIN